MHAANNSGWSAWAPSFYVYDGMHSTRKLNNAFGTVTDTYDNNGNTIQSGVNSFSYNSENELTTMNGGTVTLLYDGDGKRVAKTVSGVTMHYLVDDLNPTGLPQVVDELVGGSVERTYTYGLARISENQFVSGTWTPSFYGQHSGGRLRKQARSGACGF